MSKSIYQRLRRIEERLDSMETMWKPPAKNRNDIVKAIQDSVYDAMVKANSRSTNYDKPEDMQDSFRE